MDVVPFIADSAAEAVAQIRSRLGPEAIVLNVRPLPREGWSRLWQRPRIEVFAYAPECQSTGLAFAELRQEIAELKQAVEARRGEAQGENSPNTHFALCPREPERRLQAAAGGLGASCGRPPEGSVPPPVHGEGKEGQGTGIPTIRRPIPDPNWHSAVRRSPVVADGGWSAGALLESMGILPIYAQRVVERLQACHGDQPPASLTEELHLLRAVLLESWRKPSATESDVALERHVFVGPAGVGKTTCLCKWLAQSVLLGGRSARVWRLDGHTANTAESLSVYGEILGVPVDRAWSGDGKEVAAGVGFIDLPGIDWQDETAMRELGVRLDALAPVQVHLVLNTAYEVPVLLAQARAFGALPVADLILTHLDEERCPGKLWNLVLGTNYSLRFLSAGQNIPGEFQVATPGKLLGALLPCN